MELFIARICKTKDFVIVILKKISNVQIQPNVFLKAKNVMELWTAGIDLTKIFATKDALHNTIVALMVSALPKNIFVMV